MTRRSALPLLVLPLVAALLAGCTRAPTVVEGAEVTVAVSQGITSLNPATSYGSASRVNQSVADATSSGFASYDATPALVEDESFGSWEVVSDDPLVVTYTVRDGVTWSDGTPVDAADLLLAWAADSGALDDPDFDSAPFVDEETGRLSADYPDGTVFFDGRAGTGLQFVTSVPEIGDGGRSITITYDRYVVDWPLAFDVGLPAHIVAARALDLDETDAKEALLDAVRDDDRNALAEISRFWNTAYDITSTPDDAGLLVGNGPYVLTELVENESATLVANPRYRGDHRPTYETVRVTVIADPLEAVQQLAAGTVDVIAPTPTAAVSEALVQTDGIGIRSGYDGAFEKIDLQVARGRSGVFDDPLVRQAFAKTIPRQQIVDELVAPLQEEAQVRDSQVFLPGTDDTGDSGNGAEEYDQVDIPAARALLAEAGVGDPEVCVLFDPANPRRVSEFELVRASAAEAGIRVTDCSSTEWRSLLGVPGAYDAALYSLRATNLAVTAARASFASNDAVNNTNHYANPEVDALLDELDQTRDGDGRIALLTRIDELVWADVATIPLYQFPTIVAYRDDVGGVVPAPLSPGVLGGAWAWTPATG